LWRRNIRLPGAFESAAALLPYSRHQAEPQMNRLPFAFARLCA
jgi:hypothetical protein